MLNKNFKLGVLGIKYEPRGSNMNQTPFTLISPLPPIVVPTNFPPCGAMITCHKMNTKFTILAKVIAK